MSADYRYSPWAWAVAAERSQARSDRRRRRMRRYAIALNTGVFLVAAGLAVFAWWVA